MIGQTSIREQLEGQVRKGRLPKFLLFIGEKGCGKKTLATEVSKLLEAQSVFIDCTADGIRNMIELANTVAVTTVYIIPDADNMSQAAENAMLKVVEEPPVNAYFIMTCEDHDNILPTIKSRACSHLFEPYNSADLCDFCEERGYELNEFVLDVATVPGDIVELNYYALEEFENYLDLVIENVGVVGGSNAFKIGDKLNLKGDDSDKYDLKVFLKAFSAKVLNEKATVDGPDMLLWCSVCATTGNILSKMRTKGANKQMIFDEWLLDVRRELM